MNDEKFEQESQAENSGFPPVQQEPEPDAELTQTELPAQEADESAPESAVEAAADAEPVQEEPVQSDPAKEDPLPEEPVPNPEPQVQSQPVQNNPAHFSQQPYPQYQQYRQGAQAAQTPPPYAQQFYAQYAQYTTQRQQPYGTPQWNAETQYQQHQQQGYSQQNTTYPQYGYTPYQQYQQPAYGAPMPAPEKKKTAPPLTPSQKRIVRLLQISAILLAAILLYCIISDVVLYSRHSGSPVSTSENVSAQGSVVMYQEGKPEAALNTHAEPDETGAYSVEEIAELVGPSIVEITVYYGDEPISTGSGIILSEDGYILTNAHVIIDGDSYDIAVYEDETLYPATLVGYDSKSDLAVLHTDVTGLIPATLGDSDELTVGEEVVAIGSPAGLTGTVTNGIVSALGRQIRTDQTGFYMECIQTNAAISPGNSGGALVNMYGQVVGITSSKYAAMYGNTYEGLGFAITVNQALPIVEELINQGYVSGRVRIGITFISMAAEGIAEEYAIECGIDGEAEPEGVWITEISKDCDIADSGLEVNDILLSVEGYPVNDYDDLCFAIEGIEAGVPLEAECRRYNEDGSCEEFTIRFELMEDTSGDY